MDFVLAIVLASLMVSSARTLGEWVGLYKIDYKDKAGKVVGEAVPF